MIPYENRFFYAIMGVEFLNEKGFSLRYGITSAGCNLCIYELKNLTNKYICDTLMSFRADAVRKVLRNGSRVLKRKGIFLAIRYYIRWI